MEEGTRENRVKVATCLKCLHKNRSDGKLHSNISKGHMPLCVNKKNTCDQSSQMCLFATCLIKKLPVQLVPQCYHKKIFSDDNVSPKLFAGKILKLQTQKLNVNIMSLTQNCDAIAE